MNSKILPLIHIHSGSYQKYAHQNKGVNSKNTCQDNEEGTSPKDSYAVDLGNNLPRLEEALFKERNLIKFLMYLNRT